MRRIGWLWILMIGIHVVLTPLPVWADETSSVLDSYQVDKIVADFPPGDDDFSTPEKAYASIERRQVAGTMDWIHYSGRELRQNLEKHKEKLKSKPFSTEEIKRRTHAKVLRVHQYRDYATVEALWDNSEIDSRSFHLENGQWLNTGNSRALTLDESYKETVRIMSRYISKPMNVPVEDPQKRLQPFVDYLQQQGRDPKTMILEALTQHRLTVIGEVHHRPDYWALLSQVVSDSACAESIDRIYLELPLNDQPLVDQFLASKQLDTMPIIEMLRDMFIFGWPDQAMLDFFVAVWKANQARPEQQPMHIVLVDMARPWAKIQKDKDWIQYSCDRDKLMAENVLADLKTSQKHAMMVVGFSHAQRAGYRADPSIRIENLGDYLEKSLGAELYTFVQHSPVLHNMGGVEGRTCLGLFDSAFAANGNKPVAFSLKNSPFGNEFYDFDADNNQLIHSRFADAFDGYLYLGRLEEEIFSPVIAGFYTDGFVKEIKRRIKLSNSENVNIPKIDGKIIETEIQRTWGQPREWIHKLGPLDAWKYGDHWKETFYQNKMAGIFENPAPAREGAIHLLESLRDADYQKSWKVFSELDAYYMANRGYDSWIQWVCRHFSVNSIVKIEVGKEVSRSTEGYPQFSYTLHLKDGRFLEGMLPMKYDPLTDAWCGFGGLDWHLECEPIKEKE